MWEISTLQCPLVSFHQKVISAQSSQWEPLYIHVWWLSECWHVKCLDASSWNDRGLFCQANKTNSFWFQLRMLLLFFLLCANKCVEFSDIFKPMNEINFHCSEVTLCVFTLDRDVMTKTKSKRHVQEFLATWRCCERYGSWFSDVLNVLNCVLWDVTWVGLGLLICGFEYLSIVFYFGEFNVFWHKKKDIWFSWHSSIDLLFFTL